MPGMSTFRKILVPVDFSEHSDEAVRVASDLAKLCGAPLTLVHVYQLPVYPLPEGAIFPPPEAVAEQLTTAGRDLDKLAATARAAGAPGVETVVRQGVPFSDIVAFARDGGFDLIVMGTHGRTGLKHLLIGSVAEKVVRKAPCAVLTIRGAGHTFEHP